MTDETSFFDTATVEPVQTPVDPPAESARTDPPRSRGFRLNMYHGLGMLAVLAVFVIVGVNLLGPAEESGMRPPPARDRAASTVAPAPPAHLVEPRGNVAPATAASPDADVSPAIPELGMSQAMRQPVPAPAASVAAPAAASVPANPAAPAEDAALFGRVSAVEMSATRLEGKVDALVKTVDELAVKHKAADRSVGTARPMKPAVRAKTAVVAKTATPPAPRTVRALNGIAYSVHTIARGIAWVQAGDHIDIVQPGDRLGDVRVLSIDPVARRVLTTDGVIQ